MSDESQVSTDVLAPTSEGQLGRANEPEDLGKSGGQPSDNGKVAQGSEQENVRKLQATYDKKLVEQQRAHQAQMNQAYGQINGMRQQLNQMQEAQAPDDFARLELKLQRALEEKQAAENAYYQVTQQQQADQARAIALKEVADEFEVPVKALEAATDYKSAVKLAIKAQQDAERNQQQHEEDRREANRPDVGGGRTSTPSTRWEQQYETAMKNRDSVEMTRLLRTQGK